MIKILWLAVVLALCCRTMHIVVAFERLAKDKHTLFMRNIEYKAAMQRDMRRATCREFSVPARFTVITQGP